MFKTTRWLKLAIVIGAAIVMLALAACGGDDDDNGSTTTGTQTAGGGAATNGADATDEPSDGGDGSTDAADIFAQLDEYTQNLDRVTGKLSYDITDPDGSTTSYTLYADETNSRYDTTDSDGNVSTVIYTTDKVYTCDSSSETCTSYSSESYPGFGLDLFGSFLGSSAVGAYVAAAEAAGFNVDTSGGNYGGQDATCYSWSEADSGGKFCFADSGVMVHEELTDSEGTTSITATEYSGDVSASDFEPPYTVTDLDLGQ